MLFVICFFIVFFFFLFFFKIIFFSKCSFRNAISVSNSLDSDLGLNWLQKLSADDTSRLRVNKRNLSSFFSLKKHP